MQLLKCTFVSTVIYMSIGIEGNKSLNGTFLLLVIFVALNALWKKINISGTTYKMKVCTSSSHCY